MWESLSTPCGACAWAAPAPIQAAATAALNRAFRFIPTILSDVDRLFGRFLARRRLRLRLEPGDKVEKRAVVQHDETFLRLQPSQGVFDGLGVHDLRFGERAIRVDDSALARRQSGQHGFM